MSRVVVLSVDATGFAIISFSIIPGRGLRPDERAVEFTSQLAHERSLLRTSFWGSRLDPGYNTTYEARAMTRCSDLVYREVCPSPLIPKPTEENNLWVYALAGLITGLIVSILMIMFVLYRRRTEHIRKLKKEARAALAREAEEKAEAEAREQERIRAMAEAEAEIAAHQLALEAGDDMDGSATFGGGKPNAKAAAGKGGALSKAAAGKGGAAAVGKTAAAAAIVAKDPKRKGKATAKDDVIEMSVLTDNPVPVYAGTNPLLSLLSDTPAAVENDYEQTEPFDDGAGAGGASGSGAQSFPMQDLFSPPPPAGTSSPAPAPTPVRTTATPVVTAPVPMSAAASKAAEAAYFSNPFAGLSDPSTDFKRDAYAPRKKTQDDDYSMMM